MTIDCILQASGARAHQLKINFLTNFAACRLANAGKIDTKKLRVFACFVPPNDATAAKIRAVQRPTIADIFGYRNLDQHLATIS